MWRGVGGVSRKSPPSPATWAGPLLSGPRWPLQVRYVGPLGPLPVFAFPSWQGVSAVLGQDQKGERGARLRLGGC